MTSQLDPIADSIVDSKTIGTFMSPLESHKSEACAGRAVELGINPKAFLGTIDEFNCSSVGNTGLRTEIRGRVDTKRFRRPRRIELFPTIMLRVMDFLWALEVGRLMREFECWMNWDARSEMQMLSGRSCLAIFSPEAIAAVSG